jgi:hypothetical protein
MIESIYDKNFTGFLLWEGPSQLDGKPIMVVAVGLSRPSENEKTGNMIQTYIMRQDIPPHHAITIGADKSICGNCPHRQAADNHPRGQGTCYVKVFQSCSQVFDKYSRKGYPQFDPNDSTHLSLFENKMLRLGSYGDPAAVPIDVWKPLLRIVSNWTGYTHQWENPRIDKEYRKYCMASTDTENEAKRAIAKGWRTFYVGGVIEDMPHGFMECPASENQGKRLTCDQCRACRGNMKERGASVFIIANGLDYKSKKIREINKRRKAHKSFADLLEITVKRKKMAKVYKKKYPNAL